MTTTVQCDVCGDQAAYVNNREIYGRSYGDHPYCYFCRACGASVGVHPGTRKPLGKLADRATRQARSAAHAAFDPLWKIGMFYSRSVAYAWLSVQMGLPKEETHIGMMDIDQCQKVIAICHRIQEPRT